MTRILSDGITVVLFSLLSTAVAFAADAPSAGNAELFARLDANHDGFLATDEITPENRQLFERLIRKGDADHDGSLSKDEFLKSLTPAATDKPIEEKQSTGPQAAAVRYLLLTLDKNQNAVIEEDEIPKKFAPAFEFVMDRLDINKNGRLERYELARGGPALAQIAMRYVEREGIDVKAELARLEKEQGDAVNRFDDQQFGPTNLTDPKKAKQLFAQLDQNGDGFIEKKEIPDPLQQPLERFMRMADRDGDGKLSRQEFTEGAERLSKFLGRRAKEERRDMKAAKSAKRESKSGDSAASGNK
jgi:Ca2+-binding EF-hand superfamily protein